MALIVWLPLNGNSKNQGTKQYTETTNTLEYTGNGKTSNKCMNLGRLQYNKNPLGMVGSICFWIYPKSTDEGSNGKAQPIFGNDDWSNSGRRWTLYLYSSQPSVTPHSTSLHSWGCQKDGNTNPNGDFVINGVLKESAWNHVCVAHDLDYQYIYVNGILKRKVKWDSNGTFTFDVGTPIIYGDYSNYESNYKLNDFRIYDHCLTQSEVSEIAKGLMLHYSFENPYAEPTVNIPHTIVEAYTGETTYVTLGEDPIGKYFIQTAGNGGWYGIQPQNVPVKPGRYYTWSMDVMPVKDIEYVIDGNCTCDNSEHIGNDSLHYQILRGYSHETISTKGKGKLEANKWTRIYFTVKMKDCSNPIISHTFHPYIPDGDTEVKVYYRNSLLEEKPYDTPYTSSSREAGLIRDNSGMGNDGIMRYQREEIPIVKETPTSAQSLVAVVEDNSYTITGFNGATNQCIYFGKINYNSRYHYLNCICSYEFDIKLENVTLVSGQTPKIYMQGPTTYTDDTNSWIEGPLQAVDATSRTKNCTNGTYHICAERKVTNSQSVTNVSLYNLGFRFDYIQSGTITISNLHAYYRSLDTSTLSITDHSAIGIHSVYFNGKNYIDCGIVTPDYMDELTLSCWVYRDDWSISMNDDPNCPSIVGKVESGGFGFKLEKVSNYKGINFPVYYKDTGYAGNKSGVSNIGFDYSKLSPGWHLFTGVADKNRYATYIDGKLSEEQNHNIGKAISTVINSKNVQFDLYVGAEINNSVFSLISDLYIDDVRLYATALSEEDIKALYNVKTKIDNKSNLYCNQLVETKPEDIMCPLSEVDLNNGLSKFYSTGTFSYKDGIIKYTISSQTAGSTPGFYILNKNYGGPLIDNKRYKYSFWVRVSKSSQYRLGEERLGIIYKELEAGKWYFIEKEGLAAGAQKNLIIYNSYQTFVAGDTIEIRDIQVSRLDDQNYNSGPNKQGQFRTFELNETFNEGVKNSGATIVDKYGAEWLEVFYHNSVNGTVIFADEQEVLHTNSQNKFSILDQLESFRGKDKKFEFLLEYPTDVPNQYNRWKQSDNPVEVQEVIDNGTASTVFASGYQAIHIDWTGQYWGGLLRTAGPNATYSYIDGAVGHANWYYSIGQMKEYFPSDPHLPGPAYSDNVGRIIHNDVHLYVRIDNLEDKNEIFRQYKRQTKTKEIIEI